jgi:molecular chaperone IbpA
MLDQLGTAETGYPPYNIERTGGGSYRISVAVAGFADQELSIEVKENALAIRGEKQPASPEVDGHVLYQRHSGPCIRAPVPACRSRSGNRPSLRNGLLHVDLVREIPEAKKPRQIPINAGESIIKRVEAKAASRRCSGIDRTAPAWAAFLRLLQCRGRNGCRRLGRAPRRRFIQRRWRNVDGRSVALPRPADRSAARGRG